MDNPVEFEKDLILAGQECRVELLENALRICAAEFDRVGNTVMRAGCLAMAKGEDYAFV